MAYHFDKKDNAIVINGFEQGIADDPYSGIADIRNVNLISVPKEASVNFSTSKITYENLTGTMTNSDAIAETVSLASTGTLDTYMAIQFSVLSDATKGISLNTIYWLVIAGGGTYNLYSDYNLGSLVNITGNGLTGTWATINMSVPKYFNHYVTPFADTYFLVDSAGLVWSNFYVTPNTGFFWTYTGNVTTGTHGTAHGNGLVSYIPSDVGTTASGYLFVFRDFQIDYATVNSNSSLVWTYGWNPATGTTGNNNYLKSANGASSVYNHEALVAPDNKVYYCDSNWIGRWYQASPTIGFLPGTTTTYVFDQTSVLPFTDVAQCLAPLGNNLLIGGKNNVIYPWDTFSQLPQYPILVAENNIQKMVTVNTNTFALVGNRGRIYVTNGSQAQLYKKIPDHISGTVEPYYQWGGLTSNKNQIYFSALVTTNGGVAINQYGGVWGIDVDTKAIRLTNTLSYQTTNYNGYASAIIPNFGINPAGTGLFIGWSPTGTGSGGIDTTVSAPYTGSTAVAKAIIDSDLIPIGTFDSPTDFNRVEYKLSRPLVSGERVILNTRLIFNTVATGYSQVLNDNTVGNFSSSAPVNFKNAQWIQIQAVLTSTASSPSYVRLTEMRIK